MASDENIHVVLLPWLAFGHIMPSFQLSIALARAGVHASLVSTTKNIQRLPKLPPDLEGSIDLVGLPLPAIDRNLLPEGAEATIDIPFHKIQYLKIAYDLLKNPFKQFIADQAKSPDWIVADLLTHWAGEVGQELNIPIICFYPFSAATAVFFGPPEYLAGEGQKRVRSTPESLMRKPEWVDFPSMVAYRKREAIGVHAGFYHENASGIATGQRIAKVIQACKAVAIRSCPEFERDYFNLQEKITGKPAIPLGFLPPETSNNLRDESWNNIFQWLDEQKPIKSVVFVGFGSECKLRKDQIHEIAYGLEVSGLPFIWVLQKPSWGDSDNEDDILPSGFGSRVRGKGIIQIGWAPQREILAHPAVGGCLFHAGWGSVTETLQYGHSLVVLPFIVDQGLNSRYLVEKGLAIEVERSEDGSFSKDDIAQSLRRAMVPNVEDEGEALRLLRARAAEAAALFGDRELNGYYIERFVEYLMKTENGVQT
ncbi:UDP-glycosyltransferase 91C1-like [Coffea arabica]|uniref:UDP-glycosyltransferase 91C1-like n=1 Tax=Coffea arabica TaxID=13443 RepID=A0A6P6W2M3_COFAR|nr:UDP-glycosyltransferase 91C1-like [Coffea arabica]XP_027109598.1 UDP-glycosyltransferase 91C1-like [Coffea arabica]